MEDFLYESMAKVEEEHFWFSGRRAIIESFLGRCLNSREKPLEIFEAGCGTGGNLSMLFKYGNVYGMELDDGARCLAQQKVTNPSIRLYGGSLPHNFPDEIRNKKFDLIVLFDVLEHIENDLSALQELSLLLKKDGHLFITVPALPFLWSKHDEKHHHYRRYTKASLQTTIIQAGLKVNKLTYFNFFLFPAILAARLWNKCLKKTHDDLAQPSPLLNGLLTKIFASERFYWKFSASYRRVFICCGEPL